MQCRGSGGTPSIAIQKHAIYTLEVHLVSIGESKCPVIGDQLSTSGTLRLWPLPAMTEMPFVEQFGIGQCLGILP